MCHVYAGIYTSITKVTTSKRLSTFKLEPLELRNNKKTCKRFFSSEKGTSGIQNKKKINNETEENSDLKISNLLVSCLIRIPRSNLNTRATT